MNRLVLLAILVVVGILACWRELARNGDVSQNLAREAKRRRALERESDQVQRRIEAKQLVIAELIAGRMELGRAARRFAEINATSTEETTSAPTSISFADEEACSRSVLSWVRAAIADDPARAARILSALEEEHRQRLQPFSSSNKTPAP